MVTRALARASSRQARALRLDTACRDLRARLVAAVREHHAELVIVRHLVAFTGPYGEWAELQRFTHELGSMLLGLGSSGVMA